MAYADDWRSLVGILSQPAASSTGAPASGSDSGAPPHRRWYVLFGNHHHSLLIPKAPVAIQRHAVEFFATNWRRLAYARFMLRLAAVVSWQSFVPEVSCPWAGLQALLEGTSQRKTQLHAALMVGTPGPFQKASVLFFDNTGTGNSMAKIAMKASADERIKTEAHWLRELEARGMPSHQVPRLLREGETAAGRAYMVLTTGPTGAATRNFTPAHQEFLSRLTRANLADGLFRDSDSFQLTTLAYEQLKPGLSGQQRELFAAALQECGDALSDGPGPLVLSHGDFVPWNTRLSAESIFVFDWETARGRANPLHDMLHFALVQYPVMDRRISVDTLRRVLREMQELARTLYPEWRWDYARVGAYTVAYMLEVVLSYASSINRMNLKHSVVSEYTRLLETRPAWLQQAAG